MAWSPDGETLAFVSGDRLFVIGVDGRGERRLARDVGYDDFDNAPAWSPDGSSLVFEVDSEREDYESDAVFTVRADGKQLRRLTPATAENYTDPVWSPDGRQIAFNRTRIRGSYNADVSVVNVDGTALTSLTGAFPDDFDYGAPSWTTGRVGVARRPVARMVRPTSAPVAVTRNVVELVAHSGGRGAAVVYDAVDGTCALATWGRRRVLARPRPMASGTSRLCVDDLALSPTRAYWTLTYEEGNHVRLVDLWTRSANGASKQLDSADYDVRPYFLGNLRGDATIQVYNTWWGSWRTPKGAKLWLLDGTRKHLIRSGPDSAPVIAAGAGRVVVLTADNAVVVLDASGRLRGRIRVGRGPVLGAALDRQQLVLLRRRAIEAYDLRSGHRRRSRELAASPVPVRLHDAYGDVVVYSRGVAITLLRLSSGRTAVLDLPNQAGPTSAALEPDGLYYSFNVAHTRRPGRIAFVPGAGLEAALG